MGLEPTPLRLRKAREAGDSAIAPAIGRLLSFAIVGLGASAALRVLAERFDERLRHSIASPEVAAGMTGATSALWDVVWISAPLLAAAAVSVVVVGLAQTGGVVRIGRDPRRSDGGLWKGLAWLKSAEPWASAGRSTLALGGIAAVALVVLRGGAASAAATAGNAAAALSLALGLIFRFFELALVVLVASAAIDVVIRRGAWLERWRLSPRDARREQRDAESPEAVRTARRRAHEELSNRP
jgi:flagellar biosynthesis protein FlhB